MATLVNTTFTNTDALSLPTGTTAQRPVNPGDGDFRYNTDRGYVEYYWKGFWVDPRNGLGAIPGDIYCYLNAGVTACYPGTGSTLTDLSGNGRNGTMTGSPTYSSNNGGYLYGEGATQKIDIPVNLTSTSYTIFVVSGYNGSNRGRILTTTNPGGSGSNWLLGHHSGGNNREYYAEGWVNDTLSSALGDDGTAGNAWAVHCGTGDFANDYWGYFCNGHLVARSNAGSNGPLNLQISGASFSGQNSSWKWQSLLCYNRVLSDLEIQQVSNAFRYRNNI